MKTEIVENIFGQRIKGLKNDYIINKIKQHGIYERNIINLLYTIVDNNFTMLDVGANIGNHSLALARIVKQVYSFEPVSMTFSMLEENIKVNNQNNIKAFNIGLSNIDEIKNINIDTEDNIGASSIIENENSKNKESIKLFNGDNFLKENNINQIDLIKVDVEGYEINVLEGLKGTIEKYEPMVIMEFNKFAKYSLYKEKGIFENMFKNYDIYTIYELDGTDQYLDISDFIKIYHTFSGNISFFKKQVKRVYRVYFMLKAFRKTNKRHFGLINFKPELKNIFPNILLIPKSKKYNNKGFL